LAWLDYERKNEPLAPFRVFIGRILNHGGIALVILLVWCGLGTVGYHFWGPVPSWLDAFYNAAMISGGMGPVSPISTKSGMWFASIYALLSGVVLIAAVGFFLTPLLHRVIHVFHLDDDESS
jgi:hypothetical protein